MLRVLVRHRSGVFFGKMMVRAYPTVRMYKDGDPAHFELFTGERTDTARTPTPGVEEYPRTAEPVDTVPARRAVWLLCTNRSSRPPSSSTLRRVARLYFSP